MENRKIVSPGPDSDVEINPSGEKRVKVSHHGGFIIGNDSDDFNNVKLHRGPGGSLQVVSGDDTTEEGLDSPNKKVISVSAISVSGTASESSVIGNSGNASENVKLRRSGVAQFEVAIGSASAPDGTSNPTQRTQAAMGSIILGTDSSEVNNVKIMVDPIKQLDFQEGDSSSLDPAKRVGISSKSEIIGTKTSGSNTKIYQSASNTLEMVNDDAAVTSGTPSTIGRQSRNSLQVKDLTLGSDSLSDNNIKLHRGAIGEVELVKESDNTLDGTRSANKVQLNAKSVEIGSDATNTSNVKLHKGAIGELEVVMGGDSTVDGVRSSSKAQLNVKELSVGSLVEPSGNVKIHRGGVGIFEIVSGDDSTADGSLSTKKVSANVKDISIGLSVTTSDNVKLHKGASDELDFVSGDDTTLDNVHSPNKVQINAKKVSVGSSATQSENVKLHRGAEGYIEVVTGDDTTPDGSFSPNKKQLNAKKVCVGNEIPSKNVKLLRAADGELDFVLGDDVTSDGSRSPNKALINVKDLAIGSSTTLTDNSKLHRGSTNLLQVVNGSEVVSDGAMSTNLSKLSFLLESTSGISASGQESRPAWDATKKAFVVSDGTTWKYIGENKSVAVRENLGFSLTPNSSLPHDLRISLKQADCISDPTVSKPTRISFKDTSISAVWNTLNITSSVNFIIPADAKLGVNQTVPFRIYIYLINYNGTPEFAVSQKFYDGEDLVSTTAITTFSDYTERLYSYVARSSVPLACLGYFESVHMTHAGYWDNGPITNIYNGITSAKNDKLMAYDVNSKYGPGDVALSSGKVSSTSTVSATSYTSGNLSFHLTSTGRPVQVMLQPADPHSPSFIKLYQVSSTSEIVGHLAIYRKTLNDGVWTYGDSTSDPANEVVAQFELKFAAAVSLTEQRQLELPPSMISFLDGVGAGIQTYTIMLKVDNADSKITLSNVRLIGYEI